MRNRSYKIDHNLWSVNLVIGIMDDFGYLVDMPDESAYWFIVCDPENYHDFGAIYQYEDS